MPRERLLFNDLTFHEGMNTTVRYGDKWAKRLVPEDILEAHETNGQYQFDIFVTEILCCNIGDIPIDALTQHHTGELSHADLMFQLTEIYGDMITSRSKVTVIFFERMDYGIYADSYLG